jgi:hypothetical protein
MSSIVDDKIDQVRAAFGDHLKQPELAFLRETQKFFMSALENKNGFGVAVGIVAEKLHGFLKKTPSTRLRFAFDAQSFRDTFQHDSIQLLNASTPMTEMESKFSIDVIDAVEFVVENGIGFGLIAGALSHDLNEIILAGSLEKAIFNPKVSGWADYKRALIGVAQNEEE